MARFDRTQPDRLSTSLAEAVEHIQELVRPEPEVDRASLIHRRHREIECRSRTRRRLHPHSTAIPLDGLFAECEAKSVSRVLLSVQALKHPEQTALKFGVDAGTIVLH